MSDHGGRPFILVVEDQASLRRLIVRMLRNGGCDTVDAGSAADGLLLVRQRQGVIDLAILDIVMPGTSGLDLATDLDREYPDLKILYISGYIHSVAAVVLSRQSPDRVLLKPFTEQTLLERVRDLLARPLGREPARADRPAVPRIRRGVLG
jgi:DNA-binding response OmpR family regulator